MDMTIINELILDCLVLQFMRIGIINDYTLEEIDMFHERIDITLHLPIYMN